jgi:hypothetical protein
LRRVLKQGIKAGLCAFRARLSASEI